MIEVPDIDWVSIPAGEFIYGEGSEETTLYLDAFEIARYPVTNRQYRCFVDDGGYEDERWWEWLGKSNMKNSRWPQGNRPQTNTNWLEATAFSRWISARLNENIRLPLEHEWEKAARGESGLKYPWGDDYQIGSANVNESSIESGSYLKQTTAVGLFPQDESPFGVLDLAGNVVELCDSFELNSSDVDTSSALRGGAWLNYPSLARADSRNRLYPVNGSSHLGFRLVRSPPS